MLVGAFAGVAVVLDREESGRHVVRGAADRHGRRRAEELPEGAEPIHSLRTSMLVVIFGAPPLQSGNGRLKHVSDRLGDGKISAREETRRPQTLTEAFFSSQVEEIQPGYSKLNYVFLAKVRLTKGLQHSN